MYDTNLLIAVKNMRDRVDSFDMCIKWSFRADKISAGMITLFHVLSGIAPALMTIVTADLIDRVQESALSGAADARVYLDMAALLLLLGYQWLSHQLSAFAEVRLKNALCERVHTFFAEKMAKLRYEYIEDRDAHDLMFRIWKDPENQIFWGLSSFLSLFTDTLRICGVGIILTARVWWCGGIFLLLALPLAYLAKKNGEVSYQTDQEVSLSMRRQEDLNHVLTGREAALERSVFQYHKKIQSLWREQYDQAVHKLLKAFLIYFFKTKLYEMLFVGVTMAMIGSFMRLCLSGYLSMGLFISLVMNLLSITSVMLSQLTWNIKQIAKSREFAKDVTTFLQYGEVELRGDGQQDKAGTAGTADMVGAAHMVDTEDMVGAVHMADTEATAGTSDTVHRDDMVDRVWFHDVSFRYPGQEKNSLNHINMVWEKGKHYALVGDNGAGKSTLIKLLLGLYDQYEGEIWIGDRELRDYRKDELSEVFSVVFQDFARYPISLKDNVKIGYHTGNKNGSRSDPDGRAGEDRYRKICAEWELEKIYSSLPEQDETVLGKIVDTDRELSLGQWQRLAIARALMKEFAIYIMDEPTAALDPKSEAEIYRQYEAISEGNTAILISHRLGAVRNADRIFMLRDGEIAEEGSFDHLMEKKGNFYQMYQVQRSWYQ